MGLFRKVTSISTLGLVDFRSDKERTAAYTRGVRSQSRKQTQALQNQNALLAIQIQQQAALAAALAATQHVNAHAGWYPNPQGGGQRYWDGTQWTDHYAP